MPQFTIRMMPCNCAASVQHFTAENALEIIVRPHASVQKKEVKFAKKIEVTVHVEACFE